MLSIFTFSFLFSTRGLIYIGIISLLIWCLKDYSDWRIKKKDEEDKKEKEDRKEEKDSASDSNEKLSLAHYILVSPFAALYIVGRGCMDMFRYSVYHTMWACEKSIPYIDDWLFEFVTVSLPQRYEQAEKWWVEQGKPSSIRFKEYVRHSVVPGVIEYTEIVFVSMYRFGCAVQWTVSELIKVWKRFIKQQDWEQLTQDIEDIVYTSIWIPVTRVVGLCQLAYIGVKAYVKTLLLEVEWVCSKVIPAMYQYVVSTRIAQFSYLGVMYLGDQVRIMVYEHVLKPTVSCIVRCVDKLLEHQDTIYEKLVSMYSILAPHLVWLIIEFSSIMNSAKSGSVYLYEEMIYPAYVLFKKEVKPHLAVLYQHIVRDCIYPVWQKIYPHLNRVVYVCYLYGIVPVYKQTRKMIYAIRIPTFVFIILSRVFRLVATNAWTMYEMLQKWLIRQAPILYKMIQISFEFIKKHFSLDMFSELYAWISIQSNLVYLSFERSLTSWVQQKNLQF